MVSEIRAKARHEMAGLDASEETIVVDLGCAPHQGDDSTNRLIDRHHPVVYFGFDPLLESDSEAQRGDTSIHLVKGAAWIGSGVGSLGVGNENGWSLLNATMIRDKTAEGEWAKEVEIEYFDLGEFLEDLVDPPIELIVKMNIEGGEFLLLENLHEREIDAMIDLLYISWHDDRMGGVYPAFREWLERDLRCPMKPWELW